MPPFLSKSKYLEGLKCHKLIWYRLNAKDQIPQVDAETQSTFDYGHWIGEKAKQLFPGGVEDSSEMSFQDHLKRSLELLKLRVPVYLSTTTPMPVLMFWIPLMTINGTSWKLSAAGVWLMSTATMSPISVIAIRTQD